MHKKATFFKNGEEEKDGTFERHPTDACFSNSRPAAFHRPPFDAAPNQGVGASTSFGLLRLN
jgi:hypothetical protein